MARGVPISDEIKRQVLEYVSEHGPDRHAICAATGLSYSKVDHIITRHIRAEYQAATEAWKARTEAQAEVAPPIARHSIKDVLELPVRPFEVPAAVPAPLAEGKPLRAVVIGDTHYPHQDDGVLKVALAIIKDARPDIVVHLGDLLDAGSLSDKFAQDPARLETLQNDIDAARVFLAQVAEVAPKAQRVLLEGNHEERLTRVVWGLKDAARELARLRLFQQHMSWPHFFDLDAIGWRFVGYRDQPARDVLPKLLVKHGTRVHQWAGFTAKAEWMTYGRSGISGHTHRAAVWAHADDNGVARWIEAGCTCRYDIPWATSTDWQQAITVLDWTQDRRLMGVEQALVRNGASIWRGRTFGL